MKLVWSPLAIERVLEAADYIGQDSLDAATRWAEGIFEAASKLEAYPELGRIVPEVRRPDIRELLVGNYRLIYRAGKNQVSILTVRHGRRLLDESELGDSRNA